MQTTVPDEAATLQLSAVVEDFENDTQEVSDAEDTLELKVAPVSKTTLQLGAVKPALVGEKRTLSARYEVSAGFPEDAKVIFRANGVRVGTAQADAEGNASVEHFSTRRSAKDHRGGPGARSGWPDLQQG
nr:hypothetical protein [Corynebacterium diphtheriae]